MILTTFTPWIKQENRNSYGITVIKKQAILNFSKNDIITITQIVDGGWWEGTLGGLTGWFPSNYVKEIKIDGRPGVSSPTGVPGGDVVQNKKESMMFYHNVVLQNILETEQVYVKELQTLLQKYLLPLQKANILSPGEYSQLCGNLEELINFQQDFLNTIEECAKLPIPQQRVGGLFMSTAPRMKEVYEQYSSNHPHAVAVLTLKREELNTFTESQGAAPPGSMTLTTNLSKTFTRLDKYPQLLKELERHIEESHIDRGDTQRAIAVYKDITVGCVELRKMKELEFDIISSSIRGWEGEEITKLGDVLLLSHVRIQKPPCKEKLDRLFMLFQGVLVMLSTSADMSTFTYEGKLPVTSVRVTRVEDPENLSYILELTGSMIEKISVYCNTMNDQKRWYDAITQQSTLPPIPSKPQTIQISSSHPSISVLTPAKMAQIMSPLSLKLNKTWSMSCLRPCPPLRPSQFVKEEGNKSPRGTRRSTSRRKQEDIIASEDALVLKVIEAYCTSAKTRHTVNSSLLDCPQVIIAEEEKIIFEDIRGDQTIIEEKSLVDTVYALKDQVKDLRQEHKKMRKELDDEKKARKRLELMIRKSLRSLVETAWEESNGAGAHMASM
ncbi:unnamed protein product [Owenia fusiformis]|uniref:Rho guanine nucleotide exchange factor 7 n=1 Tax=Owenia fusiformis TaxID=6347 RepID=A0A8S4NM77_OWEFU|nr:unnamed protein product [Owenia fusiformis]